MKLRRVLNVPGLDRRLFSVHSYCDIPGNGVNFTKDYMHFNFGNHVSKILCPGKDNPTAFPVKINKQKKTYKRITTDVIHDRLVRKISTILLASKHQLWDDVQATISGDGFCTDC